MGKKGSVKKNDLIIVDQKEDIVKKYFKYKPFFLKYLLPVILIVCVMFVAFYIRSGPITLNGLDDRIEQNTYNQIQNLITQNINQQYPNLNDVYKQELITKEYKKVQDTGEYTLNSQKIIVSDVVKQNSKSVKDSFKADNGQTYLNAIDPYHFLRLSENYINTGSVADKFVKDEKGNLQPMISYKLAPNGAFAYDYPEFHVWIEALAFKFNNLNINSSIGEETKSIFLLPVFFVMLSIIPMFLILRKFSNNYIAFLGSLLLVSIGTYVSRTVAGFVDTDAYNVFFPLMITFFLICGFSSENKLNTILYSIFAGFFSGLFIWAWGSGWFIFIFINFAIFGHLGYIIIVNILKKSNIKKILKILFVEILTFIFFVFSSFIFTYFFAKVNIFYLSFNGFLGSTSSLASISQTNIWPNVLSSVAELNPASFAQIISSIGGKIVFLIAMLGIVFLTLDFTSKKEKTAIFKKGIIFFSFVWFLAIIYGNFLVSLIANNSLVFLIILFIPIGLSILLSIYNKNISEKVFLVFLLSIWVAGTIYMSLNGVRFILLLAPAFAIAFGIGLYYMYNYIKRFIIDDFKVKKEKYAIISATVVISILFLTLYIPMFNQANTISKNTLPNFDDAWYSSMYKIKDNSSSDAIITSWWDFGHFFAAVAERGVTFDGGSQTTPRAHWVGRLLMENDDEISHDILQMLVCGGNEAHNTMLKYSDGTNADAVKINKIIYQTFGKNNVETRKLIEKNKYYTYSSKQVDEIMNYLACENPRENFLITSEDMVGKAGVWAHWGSWDFTKKYVRDNYNQLTPEQIAQNIDGNVSLVNQYITELNAIDVRSSTQNIKKDDLINRWFAPYPSYIPIQGRYEYPCTRQNSSLICQNGIIIDTQTNKVTVTQNLQGQIKFKRLLFPSLNNTLVEVEQTDRGDIDVLLVPNQDGFNVMLMQYPLGGSLFTKLFYLNGYGTNKFDKFDDVRSATGVRVITWKTKWD